MFKRSLALISISQVDEDCYICQSHRTLLSPKPIQKISNANTFDAKLRTLLLNNKKKSIMLRDKFLLIFYLNLLLISHFHFMIIMQGIIFWPCLWPRTFFFLIHKKTLVPLLFPKAIKNYSKPKDYQKLLHPDLVWVQLLRYYTSAIIPSLHTKFSYHFFFSLYLFKIKSNVTTISTTFTITCHKL